MPITRLWFKDVPHNAAYEQFMHVPFGQCRCWHVHDNRPNSWPCGDCMPAGACDWAIDDWCTWPTAPRTCNAWKFTTFNWLIDLLLLLLFATICCCCCCCCSCVAPVKWIARNSWLGFSDNNFVVHAQRYVWRILIWTINATLETNQSSDQSNNVHGIAQLDYISQAVNPASPNAQRKHLQSPISRWAQILQQSIVS